MEDYYMMLMDLESELKSYQDDIFDRWLDYECEYQEDTGEIVSNYEEF